MALYDAQTTFMHSTGCPHSGQPTRDQLIVANACYTGRRTLGENRANTRARLSSPKISRRHLLQTKPLLSLMAKSSTPKNAAPASCAQTSQNSSPAVFSRCLFNAAARSMGASRNEINKSARMFNDTTVAHIKTSEALRALFPTDIMTALRRPNNGAHYKDLDDRIRHFESEGWADDFELVGLADMTGRAIHIWGKRKSGRMTLRLTVIEPPFFNIGVDPSRPPIRLLCEGQNHYVALIAAALCKRPIRTVDTPRACDATQPPTPVNQQLPRGASVSSPSLILSFFLIMISISKKVLTHRLLLVAALGRAVTALKGVLLRF